MSVHHTGTSRLSEDFCRCGHVASAHADGEGPCGTCRRDRRTGWAVQTRCQRFAWNGTWEQTSGAA